MFKFIFFFRYSPYPTYGPATDCICSSPYIVCNGKCTLNKACPSSGYSKRSLTGSPDLRCPLGLEACPIMGRSSLSWECVNTNQDLESCESSSSSMIILHRLKTDQVEAVSSILDQQVTTRKTASIAPPYKVFLMSPVCPASASSTVACQAIPSTRPETPVFPTLFTANKSLTRFSSHKLDLAAYRIQFLPLFLFH